MTADLTIFLPGATVMGFIAAGGDGNRSFQRANNVGGGNLCGGLRQEITALRATL